MVCFQFQFDLLFVGENLSGNSMINLISYYYYCYTFTVLEGSGLEYFSLDSIHLNPLLLLVLVIPLSYRNIKFQSYWHKKSFYTNLRINAYNKKWMESDCAMKIKVLDCLWRFFLILYISVCLPVMGDGDPVIWLKLLRRRAIDYFCCWSRKGLANNWMLLVNYSNWFASVIYNSWLA